jgi:hypothetical protein
MYAEQQEAHCTALRKRDMLRYKLNAATTSARGRKPVWKSTRSKLQQEGLK